jgi:hypothetical protein
MFFLLSSCGRSLPHLDGVDDAKWKNDKNGCAGARATMADAVLSQKEELLSLSELEIVDVLGKPDKQELYKRNQKFYYYFIRPSPDCNQTSSANPLQLVIRFNAMGLAKEIGTEEL